MLDPHQRSLAKLAGLGAHRGQQNDGHALHIRGVASTGRGILLGLFPGPIHRARGVFTFKWHVTTLNAAASPHPRSTVHVAGNPCDMAPAVYSQRTIPAAYRRQSRCTDPAAPRLTEVAHMLDSRG